MVFSNFIQLYNDLHNLILNQGRLGYGKLSQHDLLIKNPRTHMENNSQNAACGTSQRVLSLVLENASRFLTAWGVDLKSS